jgi:CheY-like chemotaxis protein
MTERPQPIRVLLVEDNPGDADLTREALEDSRLLLDLVVASDGVEAMEYLSTQRQPDLILLDLNLPRKSGKEVLAELRQDERLAHIPVVILTSSDAEADVVQSYRLGANCYVTKPVDLQSFQTIVGTTAGFWFTIVKLPSS